MTVMVVVRIVLVLAVVFLSIRLQRPFIQRVWCPIIRVTGGSAAGAAVLSAALYVAVTALYIAAVVAFFKSSGGWPAQVLMVALTAIYGPVALIPRPAKRSGYTKIRARMVEAGVPAEQARAAAWATGPFTFAGIMGIFMGTLGLAFV